jgi:hypothetical protein
MTPALYFRALAEYSRALMDRLPIAPAIEPLAETFARLAPALRAAQAEEAARLRALCRPPPQPREAGPAGMNTIGILADRLTILVCKEWYLRHRQLRAAEADALYRTQIADIVESLAQARPGDARLLEKVSSLKVDAGAGGFEDGYYGLLSANILMWETQEMLYTRDMDSVGAPELRDYIRFFSQANMMRNGYIAQCERLYWREPALAGA